MKHLLRVLIAISIWTSTTFAQTTPNQNCCEPQPYIEVTGSAEMEIVPDEIYITVMLQEWYDGKNKVTIEKMENDMFSALKNIGIEAKDVSLSDAESNFYYRFLKEDDALLSRNYVVMVHTAEMVIKVYDAMGKMKAHNAYISKVSHSKIEEYRMQTKVNATVAAKNKAGKMLTAIGEDTGEAMLIQEISSDVVMPYQYSQYAQSNMMMEESGRGDFQSQLTYQKIKIRYEVFARFGIR